VKLDSQIVRTRIPLDPSESPIRVLVLSPFVSDASAAYQAKIAQTKRDYIIMPEKIRATIQFLKHVRNSVMAEIDLDEDALRNLPNGEVQ
jgi:hypothetical protein